LLSNLTMSSLSAALAQLQPGRQVHGISATLLPYTAAGDVESVYLEGLFL